MGRTLGTKQPGNRGRQPGSVNKKTRDRTIAMSRAQTMIEQMIGPHAFKGDAVDLLCLIYKDPNQDWAMRLDAAKAAASYERPRLAMIAAKVETSATFESLIMDALKIRQELDGSGARVIESKALESDDEQTE